MPPVEINMGVLSMRKKKGYDDQFPIRCTKADGKLIRQMAKAADQTIGDFVVERTLRDRKIFLVAIDRDEFVRMRYQLKLIDKLLKRLIDFGSEANFNSILSQQILLVRSSVELGLAKVYLEFERLQLSPIDIEDETDG